MGNIQGDSSAESMLFRVWVNTNSRCFLKNKLGTYEAENRVNLKMKANDKMKDVVLNENENNSTNVRNSDGTPLTSNSASPNKQVPQQQQQLQQPQKTKRKHRRGKPKAKNGGNKPYKKSNWKFQVPRQNFIGGGGGGGGGGAGGGGGMNNRNGARPKILRSRSLVPYNTNKFLMEEHLAEVPSSLLTPSGRTRDSSFSVDSEDNYFFSLPEDEEEFLTKEFANVYEKARVERLENLTKQQLIEECLQIEDRYSSDQGRQQQLNAQRISAEFMSKIRILEEKVRELSRENYNLRCQLMRSAAAAVAAAAAASPPSAAPPTGAACEPTPMDSSSVDSESDSSSSSSSSSSSNHSAAGQCNNSPHQRRQSRSCSTHSTLSDYEAFNDNEQMASDNEVEVDAVTDDIGAQASNNCGVIADSIASLAKATDEIRRQSYELNSSYVQQSESASGVNGSCIADDAAMDDEFPLFSPILGGVGGAASEQETSTDNKSLRENESGKSNHN